MGRSGGSLRPRLAYFSRRSSRSTSAPSPRGAASTRARRPIEQQTRKETFRDQLSVLLDIGFDECDRAPALHDAGSGNERRPVDASGPKEVDLELDRGQAGLLRQIAVERRDCGRISERCDQAAVD